MGGKFWSKEEQYYFLHTVMVNSRFNGENGTYNANIGMSWVDLAAMMQAHMDHHGLARRTYTANMLYEHWYQTVKKVWKEERLKMVLASIPRGARGCGTGRPKHSRAKKPKQRANKTPSALSAPTESNNRSNEPSELQDGAVSGPYCTKLRRRTSDSAQMGSFSAPGGQFSGYQGRNMATKRYPGSSTPSVPLLSGQYNLYAASDAPYLTHAEGAAMYHQQHLPERAERQRGHFSHEHEARRDSGAPAASNQAFNRPQLQQVITRELTPEDDDVDESSLFVEQSEHESSRQIPAPRARIELDAARTMTMFREQEMHSLLDTTPSRHFAPTLARRGLMQERPYEYQYRALVVPRLPAMIHREYAPHRGQNQVQLKEDDEDLEH